MNKSNSFANRFTMSLSVLFLTACIGCHGKPQEIRSSIGIEENLGLIGATQSNFPTASGESAESIYLLAETYFRLGERVLAIQEYEILIEEYPQNPYTFKAKERLKYYQRKYLETFSYETLFTTLFGEDYMEEPTGEQAQYLNLTSEFILKQAFQFTAVTPKKYLGIVEFFNESGIELDLLTKDFTHYLTNSFRLTDRFHIVPYPIITDFFMEVMENKGFKSRLQDHDLMFEKVMARKALSMGFNILCLGSVTRVEFDESKKNDQGIYQTEIKLHLRIIALDPLSSEAIVDHRDIFRTVLKTNKKISKAEFAFLIDETEIIDFSGNMVHNILSKIHTVEWFGRILETHEVIEEEERIPDEEHTVEWFERFFQQEEKAGWRPEKQKRSIGRKEEVVINAGSASGVSIGDELSVYRLGFTSFDTSTGRYVFDKERYRGELKITGFLDEHRGRAVIVKGVNRIEPDDLVVIKYWQH